jgi:CRP-like cAMP-binding protein
MSGVNLVSPFDRIVYLKTLPQLGRLDSQQVSRLAHEAEEVTFERGDALFSPEMESRAFHIITSGTVAVRREGGGEYQVGPGDAIGLVAMLAGRCNLSAVAATGVVALRFTLPRVLELLEEDFDLLQNSIRNLARVHMALLERVIAGSHRAPWKEGLEIPDDRGLDLLERLILIRQGGLFRTVGLEAAVMMATSMREERWPAGTALWEIGDPGGAMFMIVAGEVEATLENGDRFEAGLGYPLGNIESLAQRPRWYRPVARTDLVALRADHETFFDVMEDDFEVAEAFLQAMALGIVNSLDMLASRGEPLQRLDPS